MLEKKFVLSFLFFQKYLDVFRRECRVASEQLFKSPSSLSSTTDLATPTEGTQVSNGNGHDNEYQPIFRLGWNLFLAAKGHLPHMEFVQAYYVLYSCLSYVLAFAPPSLRAQSGNEYIGNSTPASVLDYLLQQSKSIPGNEIRQMYEVFQGFLTKVSQRRSSE